MADQEFCADLRKEISARTAAMLADTELDFSAKMRSLADIASYKLKYDPANVHSSLKRASATGRIVAALVHCDHVPCFDSVFVGKLDGEDPLTLTYYGSPTLSIKSGMLARIYRSSYQDRRFVIGSEYKDDLVMLDEPRSLNVLMNQVHIPAIRPTSMAPRADKILESNEGLDFRVCFEGVNLPRVHNCQIDEEAYDRLGIVDALGAEKYVQMINYASGVAITN